MIRRGLPFFLCAWFMCFLAAAGTRADMPELGPLAQYVAKPDASYSWKKLRSGKLGGAEYVEVILTSQTWRDITWKHQLFVLRPSNLPAETKHGLLFIAGGGWNDELENGSAELRLPREANLFAALAEQLKSPIGVLLHVPHQPIFGGKVEDEIIAYTFDEFLKTRDPEWPLLLPMVKSTVRAMDAIQDLGRRDWQIQLESFTVTGASKRGWTTWLTGAVDSRATSLAPMVIDVLNMADQMRHQRATWGTTSEQINDYSQRGLTEQLESPAARHLRDIVDPYSYRQRLVQPKLIILGTNDRYWPLDALNLYWDQLNGPKYVMYVPNNGHGIRDIARVSGSLAALYQHTAAGRALPQLDWKFAEQDAELRLRVTADQAPVRVDTWTAFSATKDFRDAKWTARPAHPDDDGHVCQLARPTSGYAAMFGELVFEGARLPYFLSTNVRIIGPAAGGE